MEIQGYFKGFVELAEVFQTLFAQEKSGVLLVTEEKTQKIVSFQFQKGKITGAHFDKEEREAYFWMYFVGSGRLSSQDFNELKITQTKKRRPFEGGLVESRIITTEDLRHMAQSYIQSVLDRLFTWEEGSYRFDSQGRFQPFILCKVALDIQPLTMESVRRLDEWPQVESSLPDENLVLLRKKELGSLEERTPDENRVLSIVDGKRTLKSITEVSGLGKIGTYHTVYQLLESDILEKGEVKAPRVKGIKKPRIASIIQGVRESPYWVGFLLFLLITVVGGFILREQELLPWGKFPLVGSEEVLPIIRKERISYLLDQYYLREGSYPLRLEDLASQGWVSMSTLRSYVYNRKGEGYSLKYQERSRSFLMELWKLLKQFVLEKIKKR